MWGPGPLPELGLPAPHPHAGARHGPPGSICHKHKSVSGKANLISHPLLLPLVLIAGQRRKVKDQMQYYAKWSLTHIRENFSREFLLRKFLK